MTDKKTEALKLAQKALEELLAEKSYWWQEVERDIVKALEKAESICKQALAEQPAQQQEPIGKWMGNAVEWTENPYKFRKGQLIYTSPPAQRTWVGLTDEEIQKEFHPLHATGLQFARAIEAKLKEKNGA